MDDEHHQQNVNLCCCEYVDIIGERNHILGCCCNCVELDLCVDRYACYMVIQFRSDKVISTPSVIVDKYLFVCFTARLIKYREMSSRSINNIVAIFQDRLRFPWRGGARQLSIDSIVPVIFLPTLGYIAAQGVWISVVVFSSLPIFLLYTHYIFMRVSSQTKFFYMWTLTSLTLIVAVFEVPVVITLDIRPEEHQIFLVFTIVMVFCGAKTRLTAEQSHVKGDIKMEGANLQCAVCHKNVLPRTFHCRICRTCIIKRDQHCAWLDCCIGESNYRWYMATLVTAVCQLALCSNLILTTVCHPFTLFANIMLPDDCSDVYVDILFASIFVTSIYAMLAMMFILVLLVHECWLISLGMTGHEWRNLSVKVCCGLRSSRPYSKGLFRNWLDFFLGVRSRQASALTI